MECREQELELQRDCPSAAVNTLRGLPALKSKGLVGALEKQNVFGSCASALPILRLIIHRFSIYGIRRIYACTCPALSVVELCNVLHWYATLCYGV